MTAEAGGRRARRLERLGQELADEGVPVPLDGPTGEAVLDEVDYALRPASHEGRAPRYGAVVTSRAVTFDPTKFQPHASVEPPFENLAVLRRLADGRSSFLLRAPGREPRLVCFDHTIEYEASVERAASRADGVIIQRLLSGQVRVCSDHAITTWDGSRWWVKPRADHLVGAIRREVPAAQRAAPVLAGLAELCVHWLSAGGAGAVLVWDMAGTGSTEHRRYGAAVRIPELDLTRREHYPPLLSVLSQFDRAALVDARGRLDTIGVALAPSAEAARAVEAFGGTRHTSARRFSRDEPSALVFVVSESGPVTVFHAGSVVAALAERRSES